MATKAPCTTVSSHYDPNDICTACGPIGSACYTLCQSQLAINHVVVPCASAAYATAAKKAGVSIPSTSDIASAVGKAITDAFNNILTPLEQALPIILEKAGLFIFALILIIIGFLILR